MRFIRVVLSVMALSMTLPANAWASAIILDDFQDGTVESWVVSGGPGGGVHPAPPANIATGGPSGAGDRYMRLTALGGLGAGSRLTVNNMDQWAMNYIASGVTQIEMDVNNLGNTDLVLRLLFEDPMGAPPTNIAFSDDGIILPAGGGWIHAVFDVTPGALVAALGTAEGALLNTTALRIFHSPVDVFPGEPIVASLGVDNIAAIAPTAVPEPTSLLLLGAGGLVLIVKLRRRKHQRKNQSR
jgi:hypothetical protein